MNKRRNSRMVDVHGISDLGSKRRQSRDEHSNIPAKSPM